MDPFNKAAGTSRDTGAARGPDTSATADVFANDPLWAARPRHVKVRAPGKINAFFQVGPLRPDGYHSVASTYLAVSRYEEVLVTVKPGTDATDITVSIGAGSTLDPVDLANIPLDKGNLAVQAALLVADISANPSGIHIEITKHVPIAGGMGGGSADAAATLVACDALWHTGLSREELSQLGSELGADVPFALLGGAAVGLGIGDKLTAALAPTPLHWVLVPAGFGLSTPVVYGTLDALREASGREVREPEQVEAGVLAALRAGDPHALAPFLRNDLGAAAESLAPALSEVLALGDELGALASLVSGSGPTLAFLASDADDASDLAAALAEHGHQAWAVEGPVHGAAIIP
ncbi:4-(cytidine 5'-diphospho)-2-C-methyl-D-erythritol kinase [Arthrobacter glacialis]|uniref:4-diphosphocytidyl-2-C-methyl-D-erythritol kinase n=1 Tax=Arthrobacter glacialis TaxID=1664 RepID=A0A2S4A0R7_ARTGL|nr:4-(cytidine 5'-diphospho)-2-C-methyl-D-erythritol kinase [Arthrobacter glacialis]POH74869.1 4-(cytidine 5'-diphospho)-2-C-methyl-D-erythritol kinase [Arthrobacter glacialis]